MKGIRTRLPCRTLAIEANELHMKVPSHRPDQFLMEYDTFLPLLSYYLPLAALRENHHFVNWLRHTPGLSDQYATEVEYVLPAPRQAHYQDEFKEMRRGITTHL